MLLSFILSLFIQTSWAQKSCAKAYTQAVTLKTAPLITVISGTNRNQSNTLKLAQIMAEELESQGAQVEILDLAKVDPLTYSPDNYFKAPTEFKEQFSNKIKNSDGLMIVMPEYDGMVPGILLTFFNYMRSPLAGKSVSIVGLAAGKWGAKIPTEVLRSMLTHRQAQMISDIPVNIENINQRLEGSQLKSIDDRERVRDAAGRLISASKQTKENEETLRTFLQLAAEAKKSSLISLDNGLQIDGPLSNIITKENSNEPIYLQFQGATQLMQDGKVLDGQGKDYHKDGFGMPVGELVTGINADKLSAGEEVRFEYKSGIVVTGIVKLSPSNESGQPTILTLTQCWVKLGEKTLFKPSWGPYDLVLTTKITGIRLN